MFEFTSNVPAGTSALGLVFDYNLAAEGEIFRRELGHHAARAETWNQFVLYTEGVSAGPVAVPKPT